MVTDLPPASLIVVTQDLLGLAVDMDRAGAASGHPASEFCAGEAERVAKIPEQRHRRIAVEGLRLAIDVAEFNMLCSLSRAEAAVGCAYDVEALRKSCGC